MPAEGNEFDSAPASSEIRESQAVPGPPEKPIAPAEEFSKGADGPPPGNLPNWRVWLAWGAIALGLILFIRSAYRSQQQRAAAELTAEGVELLKSDRAEEALERFDRAVALDPTQASPWANRAAAHIDLENFDQARADCEKALEQNPNEAVALANLGLILRRAGDLERARDVLSKAVARDPTLGQARLILCSVEFDLGQTDTALRDATEALHLMHHPPEMARAFELRGLIHLRNRDFSAALSDFSEAARLDPERAELQSRLAEVFEHREEFVPAEAHATRAIELGPGSSSAWTARANIRLRVRKFTEAIGDCDQALALEPQTFLALTIRGGCRIELGEFAQGIADCNAALEVEPQAIVPLLFRGDAYRKQGENAKAVDDYSEVIRRNPEMHLAWFGRGIARAQERNYDAAIADYTRVLEIDPDFAPAWFNRGLAYEALGDTERARSDRMKALEIDPTIGNMGRTESA